MKLATGLAIVGVSLLALRAPTVACARDPEASLTAIAPELVGEGSVSTPDDEFGGGPSPDGKDFYFNKTAPPHYLYVLCVSHLVRSKWGKPEVLPFSGTYRDTDGVISPDGTSMLFASDRPILGKDERRFTIWRARKKGVGWEEPALVPGPVNDAGSQVFASETAKGNIYFTTSRNSRSYDIFRCKLENGKYQPAEDLGRNLNGPGIASFEAWVAPDESYLLIGAFGRANAYGSADLYISFRDAGGWTKPKNLGPSINTAAREYSPRVSADGKWLYYAGEKGFLNDKREKGITHAEFIEKSRGITNGLGNIYRVPMQAVLNNAHRANEMGVLPTSTVEAGKG
jgi:WD40-like Beta Propeller Repeat